MTMSDGAQGPAPDPWELLISLLASFRARLSRSPGDRVSSVELRGAGKEVVQHYFRVARPELENLKLDGVGAMDGLMQALLELTNGRGQRTRYLSVLARMRQSLAGLEAQRELRLGQRQAQQSLQTAQGSPVAPGPSDTEQRIVAALERLVPTAALSYRQALADLSSRGRVSFRGPANELREAFREVLDELAPDEDVMQERGYQPEEGRTTPTQAQKVRYILRSQGASGTARRAPEQAAALVEEMFAAFARSTYQRSNIAAHIASTRREVLQMKMYVDSVLAELLQIHA